MLDWLTGKSKNSKTGKGNNSKPSAPANATRQMQNSPPQDDKQQDLLLQQIRRIAQEHPERTIKLLQAWLKSDKQ